MKARKGIASKTLFELGMFVLAFIVIAAFSTPAIQVSAENILRWLSGKGGEGGEYLTTDTFEDAIACAYYRCMEGCDVAESKFYSAMFDCSDFCSEVPSEFKENDKICGWNAMQYPVELDGYSSEKTLSKKLGDIDFKCVIPTDSSALGLDMSEISGTLAVKVGGSIVCVSSITLLGWTGIGPILACGVASDIFTVAVHVISGEMSYNNIIMDSRILKNRETTECDQTGFNPTQINDALSEFTIDAADKTLYLYSDHTGLWLPGVGDRKISTVISDSTYIIIPQNEEKQMQLLKNKLYRIQVEGAGDIFVKPVTEWKEEGEEDIGGGAGETYSHIEVICDTGSTPEQGLYKDMCIYGRHTFCDNKLYINCGDVDYSEELWFSMSWGEPAEGVYLYEDADFAGTSIILGTDGDLTDNNFNNKVSSMYIPAKYENVTLYEKKNYEGKNITLSGGYYPQGYHTNLGFNNKASSLKLIGPTGCWATLYNGEEYGDGSIVITENTAKLRELSGPCNWLTGGNWDNCASSIKVKEGCSVTLYELANYNGDSVTADYITIAGDSSSLAFSSKASSIRVG